MSYKHIWDTDQPNNTSKKLDEMPEGGMPVYNRDIEWLTINYQLYGLTSMLKGFSCVLSGCLVDEIDTNNKTVSLTTGYILINDTVYYFEGVSNQSYPFAIVKGSSSADIRTFDDGNTHSVGEARTYAIATINESAKSQGGDLPWSSTATNDGHSPSIDKALNYSFRTEYNINGELTINGQSTYEYILFNPFTPQKANKIINDLGKKDGEMHYHQKSVRSWVQDPRTETGKLTNGNDLDVNQILISKYYAYDPYPLRDFQTLHIHPFLTKEKNNITPIDNDAVIRPGDTHTAIQGNNNFQNYGSNTYSLDVNDLPRHNHQYNDGINIPERNYFITRWTTAQANSGDFDGDDKQDEEGAQILHVSTSSYFNELEDSSNLPSSSYTISGYTENGQFDNNTIDMTNKGYDVPLMGFVNYEEAANQTGYRFWVHNWNSNSQLDKSGL